ncbi:methyl-accepting chemotaxis protein [Marinimicrobium sp. ARAG 43.8]|uniref:methyl-accepting chemotaxis protein n=1 Tax=Marinimicrobium sp. ARAG 43.8 TaxID=3418719 RepID=UPI003CFAEA12
MSYMGLQGIVHRVDQSENAADSVKLMLEARIAEKNFIARDDDNEVNLAEERLRELQTLIDNLEALTDNAQDRQQITSVSARVGEYQRAFGQYVQSAQRQRQLVTELRERAGSFIEQLDTLRDSLVEDVTSTVETQGSYDEIQRNMALANTANRANRQLLQARVNEKNYMLFALPDYAADTRTHISGIAEALDELDAELVREDRRVLLDGSQGDLERYQNAFETYIELNQTREDMEAAMVSNAREAMNAAANVAQTQRTQMNRGVERTETGSLLLPLVALLVGVVAA